MRKVLCPVCDEDFDTFDFLEGMTSMTDTCPYCMTVVDVTVDGTAKNFVPATPPATSYVQDISGAKFPKSYTFDGVNDFVFSTDVMFEDLQSLCLDLVSRLEKK